MLITSSTLKTDQKKEEEDDGHHAESGPVGEDEFTLETPISLAKRRPLSAEKLGITQANIESPAVIIDQLSVEEITKHFRNIEGKLKNKDKFFERLASHLKNPQYVKTLSFNIGLQKYRQVAKDYAAHNKKLYTDWREQLLKTFHQRYLKKKPFRHQGKT